MEVENVTVIIDNRFAVGIIGPTPRLPAPACRLLDKQGVLYGLP